MNEYESGLAAILRGNQSDASCMKAARRGAEAAENGLGAHMNPFRSAAVRGGPREKAIADCWEAARVLYRAQFLEQLHIPGLCNSEVVPVGAHTTPAEVNGLAEGLRMRDRAVDERNHRDPMFVDDALSAVAQLVVRGQPFTSDDVHRMLRVTPTHPNGIGAAMLLAAKRGMVKQVGFRRSERPVARGRMLAVYVGADTTRP